MRAAVCHAFREPLVVGEAMLASPGPGEVRVDLDACAICHSDIAYAEGAWGGALPAVYGHEAAGRVASVGPDVAGFAPGDPVLVTLIRACGGCAACAAGAPTSCAHAWDARPSPLTDMRGVPLAQGMNTAAFAEAVVVDASQVVPLPADLPSDLASLLACGVLTGVGAVLNTGALPPGASAAVIGAGGVGLNAIQGAVIAGAGRVVALDVSAPRLDVAAGFGATDLVIAGPDAAGEVRARTGGGVALAVVTTAAPAAIGMAVAMLAPGGTAVLIGLPPAGTSVPFDPTALVSLNQSVVGSRMGRALPSRDVPLLIDHWRAGRLKLAELVSGRYPLADINAAIAASKAGTARRNVIVFDHAA